MALKDWRPTKYRSKEHTMFLNTLPKYKSFEDNYYITYGDNGEVAWLSIIKEGKQIKSLKFADYKSAEGWANKYMKKY